LMSAISTASEPLIDLLLSRGADVNHRAKDGRTALICAAQYVQFHAKRPEQHELALRIVKRLLEAGADPAVQIGENIFPATEPGDTAADIAARGESPLVAEYIRNFAASSNVCCGVAGL